MSDQVKPQYFALTKEIVQEVLNHLAKDPTTALYQKVARALPVTEIAPAPQALQETPPQS